MVSAWVNGKFYLEKDQFAEAVLVENGRFSAVGRTADILALVPPGGEKIDCGGRTVLPGFNDSHLHLLSTGEQLRMVDLHGCRSIAEVIDRGRQYIAKHRPAPGTVVLGRGWNQAYFLDEQRFLNRHDLDRISMLHPVIFERACVHALTCNTLALALAGVTGRGEQPAGGSFALDEEQNPTGLFRESSAMSMIRRIIPAPTDESRCKDIRAAMAYANRLGLTSVQTMDHCAEGPAHALALYRRLREEGKSTLRITEQMEFSRAGALERYVASPAFDLHRDDLWVRRGPVKVFLDGSLGARTAWMRRDYADMPGNRGICCLEPEEFGRLAALANAHGMGLIAHAIGDRAIELALDVFGPLSEGGKNPRRNGVVHVQITAPDLLRRFRETGTQALVQPIFLHSDLHIVRDRVGDLADTSYAFHSLDRLGVPLSYGTDSPVESPNPYENIYCAVTRKDLAGNPPEGYLSQEGAEVWRAVDHYTIDSAWAEGTEAFKGRIKPGHLADMAVLSEDIFTLPPERIKEIRTVTTVLGGEIVYQE